MYLFIRLFLIIQMFNALYTYESQSCPKLSHSIGSEIIGKWKGNLLIVDESLDQFILQDRLCCEMIIDQVNNSHFKQSWFIKQDHQTHFDLYEFQMIHDDTGTWRWENPFGHLNLYFSEVDPYSTIVITLCNHLSDGDFFMMTVLLTRDFIQDQYEPIMSKYLKEFVRTSNSIITFENKC